MNIVLGRPFARASPTATSGGTSNSTKRRMTRSAASNCAVTSTWTCRRPASAADPARGGTPGPARGPDNARRHRTPRGRAREARSESRRRGGGCRAHARTRRGFRSRACSPQSRLLADSWQPRFPSRAQTCPQPDSPTRRAGAPASRRSCTLARSAARGSGGTPAICVRTSAMRSWLRRSSRLPRHAGNRDARANRTRREAHRASAQVDRAAGSPLVGNS